MRRIVITALVLVPMTFSLAFVRDAHAQASDMWEGQAMKLNLYTPHDNYCDSSTEAFVSIDAYHGFCIEKGERTAALWEDAKATCALSGKRLPEVAEWKYACTQLGYSNFTDNTEWASNQAHPFGNGIAASAMGSSGTCSAGFGGVVAGSSPPVQTLPFRCVR